MEKNNRVEKCICLLLSAITCCSLFSQNIYSLEAYEEVTSSVDVFDEVYDECYIKRSVFVPNRDESLFLYIENEFEKNKYSEERLWTKTTREKFDGLSKALYDSVLEMGKQVSLGRQNIISANVELEKFLNEKTCWSAADLDMDKLTESNGSDAVRNFWDIVLEDLNADLVYSAVMRDYPQYFFWIGNAYMLNVKATYSLVYDNGEYFLKPENPSISLIFYASEEFSSEEYLTGIEFDDGSSGYVYSSVDKEKITTVNYAIENAKRTVEGAENKCDLDKLLYYREKLCEFTDYNYSAIDENWNAVTNNEPWQIIYMFDDDPTTKVVCEGYSKSFKYLCDMTDFDNDEIYTFLVSGNIYSANSFGPHMWNVIHMDDNKNYLVDMTSCDSIPVPDNLFIVPCSSGSIEDKYTYKVKKGLSDFAGYDDVVYEYDTATKSMFSAEELAISTEQYTAPTSLPTPTVSPTITPTVTPTVSPTITPTVTPTVSPTITPTVTPTVSPTITPTETPTVSPTITPTETPTVSPTITPTETPTSMLTPTSFIPKVERISVNYDSISLRLKEKINLTVSVFPENANGSLEFTSSDTSLVSVTDEGIVCAEKYTNQTVYITVKDVSPNTKATPLKVPVTIEDTTYDYTVDEDGNTVVEEINGKGYVTIDGIWVGNFKKDSEDLIYTGKKITQDLKVYDGKNELSINKDYSLTYKNNVNASPSNQLDSPSVTIKLKGQYSGQKTLYFGINQCSINNIDYVTNNGATINYNGKVQKFVPTIVIAGRKLVNKKDYIIEYDSDSNFVGEKGNISEVKYKVTGIGNYIDTIEGLKYYIVDSGLNLSKANLKGNSSYKCRDFNLSAMELAETNNLQIRFPDKKDFVNVWDCQDISVRYGSLSETKATIDVIANADPSGKYRGKISKSITINRVKDKLSDIVEIDGSTQLKTEINYHKDNTKNIQKLILKNKTDNVELIEGVDYTVKCTGYNRVGTATLLYTGIGNYIGTYKVSYKIAGMTTFDSVLPVLQTVPYEQGGTKNRFSVKCNGELLEENVDYTVKYANNNSTGIAHYTISGKGNYSKVEKVSGTFSISRADLGSCKVTVADKKYTGKINSFKSVPTLTASNGKKLVAGKDYDKNIEYIYDDWDDMNSQYYNNPSAGSLVNVKITGIGNYAGTYTYGCYRIYNDKTNALNKLYISIDSKEYTGRAVEIDLENDVHVYRTAMDMKKKENEILNASEYLRIISYKNNIKSGNATVTFGANMHNAEGYGGTKNVNFKIVKKDYGCKSVSELYLDRTEQKLTDYNMYFVTAMFNPSDVYNPTLIWTTSDPNVVELLGYHEDDNKKCIYRAVSSGTAVITATTQDGKKKAKLYLTVDVPKVEGIVLNYSSVKMKVGDEERIYYTKIPENAIVRHTTDTPYETDDENVAKTYIKNGLTMIVAVNPGVAKIRCKVDDNYAYCFVMVEGDEPNHKTMDFVDVTAPEYGATPNDNMDDTKAINDAIKAAQNMSSDIRYVRIPSGTYNISMDSEKEYGIDLNNAQNLHILMDPDTIIKNTSDNSGCMRGVFVLDRAKNITIEGGTIECLGGDRGKVDENYFGIMVVRSSDIEIRDINIKNSKGDGIYLGKDNEVNYRNENISIWGCTIDGCIRNDIALVNADGVNIENCKLQNAKSYRMQGVSYDVGGLGIDIEPNRGSNQYVKNVQIKNCTFSNNRSDFGIHCHDGKTDCINSVNITLDGCSFDKMVYIQCGTNVEFVNTVKKPEVFFDQRNNSSVFPD